MTTQEAYDKLKAENPGRIIEAWHWISDCGKHRHTLKVRASDTDWTCAGEIFGDSFEDCFDRLIVKPMRDISKEKREAAAKLLAEAAALEAENKACQPVENLAESQGK